MIKNINSLTTRKMHKKLQRRHQTLQLVLRMQIKQMLNKLQSNLIFPPKVENQTQSIVIN